MIPVVSATDGTARLAFQVVTTEMEVGCHVIKREGDIGNAVRFELVAAGVVANTHHCSMQRRHGKQGVARAPGSLREGKGPRAGSLGLKGGGRPGLRNPRMAPRLSLGPRAPPWLAAWLPPSRGTSDLAPSSDTMDTLARRRPPASPASQPSTSTARRAHTTHASSAAPVVLSTTNHHHHQPPHTHSLPYTLLLLQQHRLD